MSSSSTKALHILSLLVNAAVFAWSVLVIGLAGHGWLLVSGIVIGVGALYSFFYILLKRGWLATAQWLSAAVLAFGILNFFSFSRPADPSLHTSTDLEFFVLRAWVAIASLLLVYFVLKCRKGFVAAMSKLTWVYLILLIIGVIFIFSNSSSIPADYALQAEYDRAYEAQNAVPGQDLTR